MESLIFILRCKPRSGENNLQHQISITIINENNVTN